MNVVSIIADQLRVGFLTRYDAARLGQLRVLFKEHDACWMPQAKAWVAPAGEAFSGAQRLRELGHGVCGHDELERRPRAAREGPNRTLGRAVKLSLYALTDGRTAIRFNYERTTIRAIRAVDGLARFQGDADPKFWLSRKPIEILKPRLSERAGIHPG